MGDESPKAKEYKVYNILEYVSMHAADCSI